MIYIYEGISLDNKNGRKLRVFDQRLEGSYSIYQYYFDIRGNEAKILINVLCIRITVHILEMNNQAVFEIKVLYCAHAGCIGNQNCAPGSLYM